MRLGKRTSAGNAGEMTRTASRALNVGDLEAARSWVERAISTRPTNPAIVNELSYIRGRIASAEGDYDSAETLLRAAHEADPADAHYARDLAVTISRIRDRRIRWPQALEVIDRTLATPTPPNSGSEKSRVTLRRMRADLQELLDDAMRLAVPGDSEPSH
jgi:tetratricopeptide (TPR) repeat protein